MTDDDTARRLTELEIKASYAEDLLDQLNEMVYRQQQLIERLQRELVQLQRQMPAADGPGAAPSPRDELPPHY